MHFSTTRSISRIIAIVFVQVSRPQFPVLTRAWFVEIISGVLLAHAHPPFNCIRSMIADMRRPTYAAIQMLPPCPCPCPCFLSMKVRAHLSPFLKQVRAITMNLKINQKM